MYACVMHCTLMDRSRGAPWTRCRWCRPRWQLIQRPRTTIYRTSSVLTPQYRTRVRSILVREKLEVKYDHGSPSTHFDRGKGSRLRKDDKEEYVRLATEIRRLLAKPDLILMGCNGRRDESLSARGFGPGAASPFRDGPLLYSVAAETKTWSRTGR